MEIPLDTLRHLHTDSGYVDRLQQECHASIAEIDHIDQPISYQEFFEKYMLPNRACVLGSWATADWRSRRDWVTTEGRPCLDFLKSQFGEILTIGCVKLSSVVAFKSIQMKSMCCI